MKYFYHPIWLCLGWAALIWSIWTPAPFILSAAVVIGVLFRTDRLFKGAPQ